MIAIQIIATVLMFVILIYGIQKKLNTPMLLLTVGLIVTAIMMAITKTSIMGKATSGSMVIDLFEYILKTFVSVLSGNGILTMSIMGFVTYMSHIKASDMFASVVTKPLKKIKSKYTVLAGALFIMMMISLVVPAASSRATLFMATVYPVLLAVGLSRLTAASTILFSTCWHMGPGSQMNATIYSVLNTGYSLADHFIYNELTILPVCMALVIAMFVFLQRHFDKKDKSLQEESVYEVKDPKELGVPTYYAIFPVLPLVFVLLFSNMLIKSITISVPAANYLAFFIAFIINLIYNRKHLLESFNTAKEYWVGMGNCMIQIVCLMTAASIFSSALVSIGGMKVIMNAVTGGGASSTGIFIGAVFVTFMYFITVAVTGSCTANIPLYGPMLATLSSGAALDKLVVMFITGGSVGSALSPTAGLTVITAAYSNVEIPALLKRTILPGILTFVILVAAVGVFL